VLDERNAGAVLLGSLARGGACRGTRSDDDEVVLVALHDAPVSWGLVMEAKGVRAKEVRAARTEARPARPDCGCGPNYPDPVPRVPEDAGSCDEGSCG
jgi:hypothetical protein